MSETVKAVGAQENGVTTYCCGEEEPTHIGHEAVMIFSNGPLRCWLIGGERVFVGISGLSKKKKVNMLTVSMRRGV